MHSGIRRILAQRRAADHRQIRSIGGDDRESGSQNRFGLNFYSAGLRKFVAFPIAGVQMMDTKRTSN
jgi:hypothetical protein